MRSEYASNALVNRKRKAIRAKKRKRFIILLILFMVLVTILLYLTHILFFSAKNNLFILSQDTIIPNLSQIEHDINYESYSSVNSDMQNENDSLTAAYHVEQNLRIYSTNAILLDLDCGMILFNKNETEKIYPASMVKIMTALVAVEHIDNLNERIVLRESMFQQIHAANATTAGFLPGESVRAIDLLYGLLLPSGAECAIALAEFVSGSESAFVDLMNEKAVEIDMSNSNFTNTTGLHNKNQYSTVMDIALLLIHALENDMLYQIMTSSSHSTASTSLRDGGITFHSTLFARMENPNFDSGIILGGRTGFTSEAGQCLASFAEIDGRVFILVTSGAQTQGNHLTQALHIDDAFTIYSAIKR